MMLATPVKIFVYPSLRSSLDKDIRQRVDTNSLAFARLGLLLVNQLFVSHNNLSFDFSALDALGLTYRALFQ